jgi:Tat protein secretion system quality control protein TatD with DNase activity
MRLPFDAHNHVHMGPTSPLAALQSVGERGATTILCGMALMSTHPRDYPRVTQLTESLPKQVPGTRIVPCYGVHPWFLHELSERDWEPSPSGVPNFVESLDELIASTPNAMVGEIGLDRARYDPDTLDLPTPIERQVIAFEAQMTIAAKRKRPVSIHSVQSFGPMMQVLSRLKKNPSVGLPPKIYFHAFGGKVGTVDQLLALCGRDTTTFGFAPVINFRSPKTADVIRHIGLDRLVLETDHEDASRVPESIENGIRLLAEALDESEETIVERTTANAFELYSL